TKIEVLAPLVRGRKGEFRDVFEAMRKQGFVRARINGETYDLSNVPKLNRRQNHDIAVVVDRLVVRPADRARLADSIETALKAAEGVVEVVRQTGSPRSRLFSERYACPKCGLSLPELEPRQFSFNSPYGACPDCSGLGTRREVNADLVLGDTSLSILEGVVLPWGEPSGYLRKVVLPALARTYKFDLNSPWRDLTPAVQKIVLRGAPGKTITYQYDSERWHGSYESGWKGVLDHVEKRYSETASDAVREQLEQLMVEQACPTCGGRPSHCPAAKGSASVSPRRSAAGSWACCTFSMSRPSVCISVITRGCSPRSRSCAISATPCWSWSTMRRRFARPTMSSTSVRARDGMAARWWPPACSTKSCATATRSRRAICAASCASPCRHAGASRMRIGCCASSARVITTSRT